MSGGGGVPVNQNVTIYSDDIPPSNKFEHVPPIGQVRACQVKSGVPVYKMLLFIAMTYPTSGKFGHVPLPIRQVRAYKVGVPVNQNVTIYSNALCRVWLKAMKCY